MNYVEHLNLLGVEAKEIPCIKASGAPTTATVGAVGLLYMDTDTGEVYKCTAVADGVYTWNMLGGGSADAVLYTEQSLTDKQKNQARENIGATTAIPKYEGTTIGRKCAEFSALMNGAGNVESFVFFTDPHLAEGDGYEAQLQEYLNTIKDYYCGTPASFVVCGGDWIGNMDTLDEACFKLGYIDGLMRRHFDDYHMVVGNHDTNEQGCDDSGVKWTGTLPVNTVRNLWNRENGANYYSFDGANTKFYVLDTWKESSMTDYHWEQIAWLAENLLTDDADNSAIALHEVYSLNTGSYVLRTFAQNVLDLCYAYNSASSVTLNEQTYDFTSCSGCVRFILGGHTHSDYHEIVNGIPVILTTHLRDGSTPTFDLCLVDYKTNIMNQVRVGTGENRTFTMAPDGAYVEPEDDVSDSLYVILLGYCHRYGECYIHPRTDINAIVATSGQYPLLESSASGAAPTGESGYFYFDKTDDIACVTVNAPSDVRYCVRQVTSTTPDDHGGYPTTTDGGWQTVGTRFGLKLDTVAFVLTFGMTDGSDIPSDLDTSSFSVEFFRRDKTSNAPVFLPLVNFEGGSTLRTAAPYRMMMASETDTGFTMALDDGSATYYALYIKEYASVTVSCPGLRFAVDNIAFTDVGALTYVSSSDWIEESGTVEFDHSTYEYCLIKFSYLNDSTVFTEDFDTSGITVEFS